MSIYVNNGGVWTLSKDIFVNNNGTWVEPQEVYINNNGTWVLSHKVIHIVANATNVNLFSVVGSPSNAVRLKVFVDSGVTIYSNSALTPALSISGFAPGSEILLINNGSIIGAGGNGGPGSTYGAGFAGYPQAGGTAIDAAQYVTIQNNGTLAGGGGGGGQGGWGTYSVSSCFPAGTMVSTPHGLKPIEDIQIGDEVYAYDAGIRWGLKDPTPIFDSKPEVRKVIDTAKHIFADEISPSPLVKVIYEGGELIATGSHEIQSSSRQTEGSDPGFVRAHELQPGDIIYNEEGQEVVVTTVEYIGDYSVVYNLEVEELHTYIANGIRVHNGGTTTTTTTKKYSSTTTYSVGGSGGGGGAGTIIGNGGAAGGGGSYAGNPGSAGTSSAGGAGGVSTGTGFRGGVGGALGQPGATGSGGSYWTTGGAAGKYINGNSYVTWEATGTRIGAAA